MPRTQASSREVIVSTDYHPDTVRWAVELTLEALKDRDDLRPVDAGKVATLRVLASAVDHDSLNAALWRQFREALQDVTNGDSGDDDLTTALDGLMSAEVRNT